MSLLDDMLAANAEFCAHPPTDYTQEDHLLTEKGIFLSQAALAAKNSFWSASPLRRKPVFA